MLAARRPARPLFVAALLAQVSSTALLHPPRSRRALYAGGAALHQLASRRASCQPRAVPLCTAAAPPTDKPPYFITTPIYYVNGQPHIGHAYTTLACDVIARFKRLDGHDVLFLTGTDEHGQKVQQSAEAAGETPQAFADRVSDTFRALLPVYNFSCDQFIRTTESRHTAAAQALWRKLLDSGDIYLGEYEGWYSVRDEAFYTEGELVDGLAPTGAPVEWVKESSYAARRAQFGAQFVGEFGAIRRAIFRRRSLSAGTSSSSPSGASRSRRTSAQTTTSSLRSRGGTRCSRSCAKGCATSRSRGRRSRGASPSPTSPTAASTSCTCGSTR